MNARSQGEVIQFRIPGDSRYVPIVRRAILSLARSLGFPEQTAEDIHISVAEAITNSVEHGSPGQKHDNVIIACRIEDGVLTIDVRDEGPGFRMPQSGECEASMEEHGRGLRLIYNLMDQVKVCRTPKGSRIRMVKINPSTGEPLETPASR